MSGSNSEPVHESDDETIEHAYGGDVGANPVLIVPEQSGKAVVVQAGLASASAGTGQVTTTSEEPDGVD